MRTRGFSLVELSIVLVILGLLVGGILAGRSLIRASELRSVTVDIDRYKTAIHAFRDKYLALPGDMPNAVTFWGAQTGSTNNGVDGTCAALTTPATGTVTCNGNGDGFIGPVNHERYRFWQHLTNAGLIEGKYTGVVASGTGYNNRSAVIGVNVPQSHIDNVGYTMYDDSSWGYRNMLSVGASFYSAGTMLETAHIAFRNEEVWNLDVKMDDGKPLAGKLRTPTRGWFSANCPLSNATDSDYDVSVTTIQCWFNYLPLQ